jgi:hypothetical protein
MLRMQLHSNKKCIKNMNFHRIIEFFLYVTFYYSTAVMIKNDQTLRIRSLKPHFVNNGRSKIFVLPVIGFSAGNNPYYLK